LAPVMAMVVRYSTRKHLKLSKEPSMVHTVRLVLHV
jgi:hypothetical protein